MPPVIIAKDLYKCYPGFAPVLRGVNIEVQPGEMVAIMGPSGCGKSTMLHILGLLHAPDSGQLEVLGKDMLKLDSDQIAAFRRGNLGFVMQASNLFEHSTVFENVEFPLIYENVPPQERWERVIRALDLVRLSSRVHYRSNRLSGGEQQRVAIARAMVNNPRVLLADEPTGALDARTSRVIMENFRRLCHNGGVAMVMVTHDPAMAEYCDSVYTLEDGALHCKKHEPPAIAANEMAGFLKPPEPIARGALVAWRFPNRNNPNIIKLAARMHNQGLLARIYALRKNSLFAGQAGYSLPLAVRRMGFWQRLFGDPAALKNGGVDPRARLAQAGDPGRSFRRGRAFKCGTQLAGWCQADSIEFLYAAGARKVAAATWVAAKICALPFAFAVRAEDIPLIGADCRVRARDAAFVTCATSAISAAFQKFAPDLPPEKIVVLPNPPLYAPIEEEPEPRMPPQPGKPLEILAMGRESNYKRFNETLAAAKSLRQKNANFHLTFLGKAGFGLRLRVFLAGLRKQISFAGPEREDRVAEVFRACDIFIAWPLAGAGMDLAMPWPVCEAMAFGLPIIALGISPGMAPLENGANCLAAGDAAMLAAEIAKLAADKDRAKELGGAARKAIREYLDIGKVVSDLAARIIEAAGLADRAKEAEMKDSDGF